MAEEEVVKTWRADGAILEYVLVAAMVPGSDEEVLEEEEEMVLWCIATTAKS